MGMGIHDKIGNGKEWELTMWNGREWECKNPFPIISNFEDKSIWTGYTNC